MRIYLSGKMIGLPDDNRPAFYLWAKKLRDDGHEVFCPPEEDVKLAAKLGREPTRRELLAQDMAWICLHAEAIAMLPGWENNSTGAFAEWSLAKALPIPFIYLS